MKNTLFTTASANDDDYWDSLDARDVFFADLLPGEPEIAPGLRSAFEGEGYSVRSVEVARTHPVLILRMNRKCAAQTADHRSLRRHLRSVLRQAGFRLRRKELTVCQTGDRILVAFQWHDSSVDYAAALRRAEEEAAELEETPL